MAQGGQSRGWKFLTITTSQCLLLVFLLLYTSIISYYLYITNEKSHLQDVIIKEKILNLQKEYQELIKMTKWIEEHPNQNHTNIIKDLHVIDQELETIERTDARKESSTSQPKFDHPHQHETITPTKSNTMIKMPPAILVVGGTDGSGTRRVVQLLTNLGVLIVSEDPETYDIHADLFGGWPKVVTPVLEAAGSIIYDTKDLPPQLQTSTETNLRRLLTQAERDSHKPESKRLAVGGALPTPPDVHASNVLYGFKAPVAMTLVPWWRKLNSHFMFLHVLRDGRDIAFSANQGPVTKFYHAMYKNRPELMVYPPAVKAIQLWADWNSGIKNWAEKEMKISPQTRDSSFRYLSVHIEDLVDESRDIRYKAIKHIAEFVGSDLDDDSLCCLSAQGSKFMGSHDREGKVGENADQTLKKKYGKWKSMLAANPSLETQLMRVGGDALDDLGYTSSSTLNNEKLSASSSCTLTIAQCNAKTAGLSNWKDALTSPPITSYASKFCSIESSTDYPGGDLTMATDIDLDGCCKICKETRDCHYYTYDMDSNTCYLKSIKQQNIKKDPSIGHLTSGKILNK